MTTIVALEKLYGNPLGCPFFGRQQGPPTGDQSSVTGPLATGPRPSMSSKGGMSVRVPAVSNLADVGEKELLTVKQVATELGLPFTRVRRLISRGRLRAVLMPAGAGTWRVSRADLRLYNEEVIRESQDRRQRALDKALAQLTASWDRLTTAERESLQAVLPAEIFGPLAEASRPSSNRRWDALSALCVAYRNRPSTGMEALAMDMPQDLLWAVARVCAAIRDGEEA